MVELQLRRVATKQKLDLTDAFEEAAGARLRLFARDGPTMISHRR